MKLTALIPAPYRALALALLAAALVGLGWVKGAGHVQDKWDAAEGARAQAVTEAVLARVAANKKEAERQAATNRKITEGKDREIATLTARLNAAGRLRVGPAICGGAATAAKTDGAGGGDGGNTSSRVLSPEMDAAVKQLIYETEAVAATGRACQRFISENGLGLMKVASDYSSSNSPDR